MTVRKNLKMILYVIYILMGAALWGIGAAEIVDPFWGGIGASFLFVGVIRMAQMYRLFKDEAYRERMEVEVGDERNRFIRSKAWAWAGYLFILIAAVSSIVLRILHQDLLSLAASCAVCLALMLYWISYLILRKKY
jgi:uncharacterized membrane protein